MAQSWERPEPPTPIVPQTSWRRASSPSAIRRSRRASADASALSTFARTYLESAPDRALLTYHQGERLTLLAGRGAESALQFNAGALVKQVLQELGGKGGGSPTFAQGTAPLAEAAKLQSLLEASVERLKGE